jgi:chorismate mutase/prephenate dehydratase
MLALLNQRAKLALELGKIKAEANLPVYSPEREWAVLSRLARLNRGPFPAAGLTAVFSEIISACRGLQASLPVAYLGPEGTFTHLASLAHFGASAHLFPQVSIGQVFAEVEKENCRFGVVPAENSTEGSVSDTMDLLVSSLLKICGEVFQPVSLDLLSKARRISSVKKLYSHFQALAQCRRWIENNLPHAKVVEMESTALAAKAASTQNNAGALASSWAGRLYGLGTLARKIQDSACNITRFLVVGKDCPSPSGQDKTSLFFSVSDEPGALKRMLEPFSRRRINLTKIESRPVKTRAWQYLFFLDLEGHVEEKRVSAALQQLSRGCSYLKILGSYPKAAKGPQV